MRKTTIINGIIIKGNSFQHLPANPELSDHTHKNQKAGNMAEIVFWLRVNKEWYPILTTPPFGHPFWKPEGELVSCGTKVPRTL